MELPFIFDRPVTGKYFLGHKTECAVLANLLGSGENVVISGPPKTGKMSLVQQTLYNMKIGGKSFTSVDVDAFTARSVESFLCRFGTEVIKSVADTPEDYMALVSRYLLGSNFVFDPEQYDASGSVISTSWDLSPEDTVAMLTLPERLSEEKGMLIIIIKEFQTLEQIEGHEELFSVFKKVLSNKSGNTPFILMGSQDNAMKAIFRQSPFFRGVVNLLPMKPVEDSLIVEYIRAGFNLTGKVIDRDVAMGPGKLFENNMWYINHIMSICDSLTRGFINDKILGQALEILLSIHKIRFHNTMNSLTGHQKSFLLAMIEQETRFSSSDVIRKYGLNSSANVIRVKEALMKKEIVSVTDRDEICIIDPLFKYWLENYYFAK